MEISQLRQQMKETKNITFIGDSYRYIAGWKYVR